MLELQGFLAGRSVIPGVEAIPGAGTNVPLYILGSSLFGGQLAAALGLPYAFASHFAPAALQQAVAVYRREFEPSEQLAEPYVIAAANVIADETDAAAEAQFEQVRRWRVARFLGRGHELTEAQLDELVASPQGRQVAQMMTYSAVGSAATAAAWLDDFATHADADELIVAHPSRSLDERMRSIELLADAAGLVQPAPSG